MPHNGHVLAMVGYLKKVSTTFVQMLNRNINADFTTVSPTSANTMLVAGVLFTHLFQIVCLG